MEFATLSRVMEILINEAKSHIPDTKTSFPLTGIADEVRQNIDREIDAMELAAQAVKEHTSKSLSDLRQRRNQFAPIHRLPPELLSEIFKLVMFSDSYFGMKTPHLRRHTLSSVSRMWRRVVEENPMLWTDITPISGSFVDRLLSRSKKAPINIRFPSDDTEEASENGSEGPSEEEGEETRGPMTAADYAARVTPHTHRWQKCQLSISSPHQFELFLQAPAPKLEYLTLYSDASSFHHDNFNGMHRFDYPVFAENTPGLRSVSLGGVYISLTSRIYHNLVDLEFAWVKFDQTGAIQQLLAILDSSPRLENLRFWSVEFPPPTEIAATRTDAIQLSCLCRAYFSNTTRELVNAILSNIATPPTSAVSLDFAPGDSLESVLPRRSPSLPYRLQNLLFEDLKLDINSSYFHRGEITCRLTGVKLDESTTDLTPTFEAAIKMASITDLSHLLSAIGDIFPLPLKKITLSMQSALYHEFPVDPIFTASFAAFLARQPLVQHLGLKTCTSEVLELFTAQPAGHLCPSLQSVTIDCCKWIDDAQLVDLVESRISSSVEDSPPRLQSLELIGPRDPLIIARLRELVTVMYTPEEWSLNCR